MGDWVNPASQGFNVSEPLRSFPATVRKVLVEPGAFFRSMPLGDRPWNPLIFAILCALISLPLTYMAAPLDPFAGPGGGFGGLFEGIGDRSLVSIAAMILVVLLLAPLFVLLGLYIGAAIYQILVGIFVGGENAGFDATLRVYAYTSVAGLLSWIPVVGYLASLYGFFLAFIGIREVHGTTTGRALGVVLAPLAFWLLVTVGLEVLFRIG